MERNNNIYINLDGETFSISIPFPPRPSRFHHHGVTLLTFPLPTRQITASLFRSISFHRENGGQQPVVVVVVDRKLKHARSICSTREKGAETRLPRLPLLELSVCVAQSPDNY